MRQLSLDLAATAPEPMASRSYHVRSHQTVEEVIAGERRANVQDVLVLSMFEGTRGMRLTPSEVLAALRQQLGAPPLLLTSVRRSMTNLTRRGLLIHHPADRRPGPAGASESTWSLA